MRFLSPSLVCVCPSNTWSYCPPVSGCDHREQSFADLWAQRRSGSGCSGCSRAAIRPFLLTTPPLSSASLLLRPSAVLSLSLSRVCVCVYCVVVIVAQSRPLPRTAGHTTPRPTCCGRRSRRSPSNRLPVRPESENFFLMFVFLLECGEL